MNPKFLIIRFPPGAAGRFLGTMLMGSKDVAHFNENANTTEEKLNYLEQCFKKDLSQWLKHEPSDKMAWGIDFVSNKYPRGDDLTVEQFTTLTQEKCTEWYHKCVTNNKRITIFWHKNYIPNFYKGECISILIDKKSTRWYHRSRWFKHYGMKDEKIHLKENDPNCHRYPINQLVAKFNNPIFSNENFRKFVKENVINSQETKPFYLNNSLFPVDNDIQINLSELLEEDQFLSLINMLSEKMHLSKIDTDYLIRGFRYWRSIHAY
jgi:hypothetical protein